MIDLTDLEQRLDRDWSLKWINVYLVELQTIKKQDDLLTCLEKICQIWRGNGKAISEFFTWERQLEQIKEATKDNFDQQLVIETLGQAAQSPGILTHGSFMW